MFVLPGYEEDGDFRLTKEDAAEANDTLPNLFVLLGSRGSCKTATVYTCAREAGFKVIKSFVMHAVLRQSV